MSQFATVLARLICFPFKVLFLLLFAICRLLTFPLRWILRLFCSGGKKRKKSKSKEIEGDALAGSDRGSDRNLPNPYSLDGFLTGLFGSDGVDFFAKICQPHVCFWALWGTAFGIALLVLIGCYLWILEDTSDLVETMERMRCTALVEEWGAGSSSSSGDSSRGNVAGDTVGVPKTAGTLTSGGISTPRRILVDIGGLSSMARDAPPAVKKNARGKRGAGTGNSNAGGEGNASGAQARRALAETPANANSNINSNTNTQSNAGSSSSSSTSTASISNNVALSTLGDVSPLQLFFDTYPDAFKFEVVTIDHPSQKPLASAYERRSFERKKQSHSVPFSQAHANSGVSSAGSGTGANPAAGATGDSKQSPSSPEKTKGTSTRRRLQDVFSKRKEQKMNINSSLVPISRSLAQSPAAPPPQSAASPTSPSSQSPTSSHLPRNWLSLEPVRNLFPASFEFKFPSLTYDPLNALPDWILKNCQEDDFVILRINTLKNVEKSGSSGGSTSGNGASTNGGPSANSGAGNSAASNSGPSAARADAKTRRLRESQIVNADSSKTQQQAAGGVSQAFRSADEELEDEDTDIVLRFELPDVIELLRKLASSGAHKKIDKIYLGENLLQRIAASGKSKTQSSSGGSGSAGSGSGSGGIKEIDQDARKGLKATSAKKSGSSGKVTSASRISSPTTEKNPTRRLGETSPKTAAKSAANTAENTSASKTSNSNARTSSSQSQSGNASGDSVSTPAKRTNTSLLTPQELLKFFRENDTTILDWRDGTYADIHQVNGLAVRLKDGTYINPNTGSHSTRNSAVQSILASSTFFNKSQLRFCGLAPSLGSAGSVVGNVGELGENGNSIVGSGVAKAARYLEGNTNSRNYRSRRHLSDGGTNNGGNDSSSNNSGTNNANNKNMPHARAPVVVVARIGMNVEQGIKLVGTLRQFRQKITLFVYVAFLQLYPGLIRHWRSLGFDIQPRGLRPDRFLPYRKGASVESYFIATHRGWLHQDMGGSEENHIEDGSSVLSSSLSSSDDTTGIGKKSADSRDSENVNNVNHQHSNQQSSHQFPEGSPASPLKASSPPSAGPGSRLSALNNHQSAALAAARWNSARFLLPDVTHQEEALKVVNRFRWKILVPDIQLMDYMFSGYFTLSPRVRLDALVRNMRRKISESGGIIVLESDFEDAPQVAIQLMRELGQAGHQDLNNLQSRGGSESSNLSEKRNLVRPIRSGETNGSNANSANSNGDANSNNFNNPPSFTSDFRLVSLQECDAIQSRAQTQTTLFYLIFSLGSLFVLSIALVYAYIRSEHRAREFSLEKLRRERDLNHNDADHQDHHDHGDHGRFNTVGGEDYGQFNTAEGGRNRLNSFAHTQFQPNVVGRSASTVGGGRQMIELPSMLGGMMRSIPSISMGNGSGIDNGYRTFASGGYRSVLMQEGEDGNGNPDSD